MHTYFLIICVNRKILIEEDFLIDGGYHHYRRCLFSEFPQGKEIPCLWKHFDDEYVFDW